MKLNRGINLGGWLSQCVHTQEHYKTFIGEEDIALIAKWGFDHVRLPVDAEVLETADGADIKEGYGYIDSAVEWCEKYGLSIIIDLHKAYGYDFNDAGDSERNNLFGNEKLRDRFVGLWEKLAEHYGNIGNVTLELLNEVVESQNNAPWNDLVDRSVLAIRAIAPNVPIIYGGIMWNNASTLKLLRPPVTDNIIYTFHFYEPLLFTHQKAYWVKTMDMERTTYYPRDMEYYIEGSKPLGFQGSSVGEAHSKSMGPEFIDEMVSDAVAAAKKAGVPLYCGEYGVIDQAPVEDTLRWFEDVDGVFREHGIGCAMWSYKLMDFGLKDAHYDEIREPLLALLCKTK